MRSSFLRGKRHGPSVGCLSSGESAAHRSSHPEKSRNAGEATLPGGEPQDSTEPPAKTSLTGGAGPPTYIAPPPKLPNRQEFHLRMKII